MATQTTNASLVDPLSEVTRKERRMLLALSMLGIFFVKAGALPKKINALGIQFESSDQSALLYMMSIGLFYFVIAFFIYAMSDFIVWRNAISEEYLSQYQREMIERDNHPQHPHELELEAEELKQYKQNLIWSNLTKPVSVSRAVFEFVLPILMGLYSIVTMSYHASTIT